MEKTIEIPEGYEARIEGNKVILERKESEDEMIRKLLIWQVYRNIEDDTNDLAQSVYDGIKGHDPDLEESIEDWKKCLAWLEKQKEQKPAEWSEKEKGILLECISVLQNSSHWLLADKLSSLRPQPHWKPSEEQMEALDYSIGILGYMSAANTLRELYADLKKL